MSISLECLSKIIEYSPVGYVVVDSDINLVEVNNCMFTYFNMPNKDYCGKKFGNVFNCAIVTDSGKICGTVETCNSCELRQGVVAVLNGKINILNAEKSHEFKLDGDIFIKWFKINVIPAQIDNKDYAIISFLDISDTKKLEQNVIENRIKYKLLFENMTQGFALHEIITDNQGTPIDYQFLDVNPAFEKLTGLKAEDIIGKRVLEILPNTEKYWIDTYGKVATTGEACNFDDFSMEINKYFDVWVFSPQKGQFATVFSDITEEKELEGKLKYYYYHDELTGLHNRKYLNENLSTINVPSNFPLSIIIGDINGLKIINEAFGQMVGDAFIKKMTSIIKNVCSDLDIVVKWGGDEFLILLPNSNTERVQQIID